MERTAPGAEVVERIQEKKAPDSALAWLLGAPPPPIASAIASPKLWPGQPKLNLDGHGCRQRQTTRRSCAVSPTAEPGSRRGSARPARDLTNVRLLPSYLKPTPTVPDASSDPPRGRPTMELPRDTPAPKERNAPPTSLRGCSRVAATSRRRDSRRRVWGGVGGRRRGRLRRGRPVPPRWRALPRLWKISSACAHSVRLRQGNWFRRHPISFNAEPTPWHSCQPFIPRPDGRCIHTPAMFKHP